YCVLFRQADLSGIVEDTNGSETNNKTRIDILKEPLNLHRYSKKEKIAEGMVKPIKKDIELKEANLKLLVDPKKDIGLSSDELKTCALQIDEKEKLIQNDLQVKLEEKKTSLFNLKSSLSTSDSDIHQKVEAQHAKIKQINHS